MGGTGGGGLGVAGWWWTSGGDGYFQRDASDVSILRVQCIAYAVPGATKSKGLVPISVSPG